MRRLVLAASLALAVFVPPLLAEDATVVAVNPDSKTLKVRVSGRKQSLDVDAADVKILNPAGREILFETLSKIHTSHRKQKRPLKVDARIRDGKVSEIRLLAT